MILLRRDFWLIAGLYLGLRILVLWTDFDSVAMPYFELSPVGNIAALLRDGWVGPELTAHYDNCGGHLLTGLLAAPLYWLLADAYWVLKLLPLGLGLICLALVGAYLDRSLGRRAAWIGMLLFALAPPTLLKYSLLAKGNHFESLAPQLLVLYLFLRMNDGEHPARWRPWLALALGLAISCYLGALIWLPILGLSQLLLLGPRRALRDGLAGLPFLLLGLAPLAWISQATAGRPLLTLSTFVADSVIPEAFLGRLGELGLALAEGSTYPDLGPLPGAVAGWLGLAAFVVAWLVGARQMLGVLRGRGDLDPTEERRALGLMPLLLYLPTLALVWPLVTLRFTAYPAPIEVGQYRYLVPHLLISAMLLGAASARGRLGRWLLPLALAPSLLLPSLVDWSFERAGHGRVYPGSSAGLLGRVLVHDSLLRAENATRSTCDPVRLAGHLQDFPLHRRPQLARGVGRALGFLELRRARGGVDAGLEQLEVQRAVAPFPTELQRWLAQGFGACLRELPSVHDEQVAQLLRRHAGDRVTHGALFEGLALGFRDPLERELLDDLRRLDTLEELVPAPQRQSFLYGRGLLCGRLSARGLQPDRAQAARIAAHLEREELAAHAAGFGEGWAEVLGEPPPVEIAQFDEPARRAAAQAAERELARRRR
jgi:hypothetical protein